MTLLIAFGAALIAFLIIDLVWIGLVMKDFYRSQIGHLMAENIQMGWATGFYLFYVAGVVFFAVRPGLEHGIWTAAGYGALLGVLAYGTYDMTNLATLRGWPVSIAMMDMAWGAALTALTAMAGTAAAKALA